LGRSRFLVGKFKDTHTGSPIGRGRRLELDYRLFLPSGSSARDSLPLIVMLHGCKQDAAGFAEGTRMNALAEQRRCAVLYPEQNKRANPLHCWNWFDPASLEGQGEAALLARMIDQVTGRRPIDARRVYVVGMSAGGAMACVLAVRHSRLFAACAIHSGIMFAAADSAMEAFAVMRSGPSAASTDRTRRLLHGEYRSDDAARDSDAVVPTLVMHGELDKTVNPANADDIIMQLAERAAHIDAAAGAVTAGEERRIEDGGRSYRQCDYNQQGRVILRKIVVEGLGHAWSGGDSRREFNDDAGPDASRLILDFLTQYRRETPIAAAARAV
jgi:poly(hydroxyalkanoate) depolymerase family esterase